MTVTNKIFLGLLVGLVVCVSIWLSFWVTYDPLILSRPDQRAGGGRSAAVEPSRQRLRSWSSDTLARPDVEAVHCRRPPLPIAAARVWNNLSPDVRSSSSLSTFKRRLKTELFSRSFPDWCDCVNFRLVCKVASQLWLMPPNLIRSVIIIY